MDSLIRNHAVSRVAGTLGVAAQVASAYVLVLYPALTVPSPENYGFYSAWFVLVLLTVAWWRFHPWRSLLTPVVSIPICVLSLWLGAWLLNWAA